MKIAKIYLPFLSLLILYGCTKDEVTSFSENENVHLNRVTTNTNLTDYFAVANRVDGTISVYDAKNTNRIDQIVLGGNNAAPTYITYSQERDLLYVADFNNPRVLVYDVSDFSAAGEWPAGLGAFHMWTNDHVDQLWVNNLMDKTTSVIDLNTGSTLQTINLPGNIGLPGDAVQHDVIISPDGNYAYVSIISPMGEDFVLQYSTGSFNLLNYTMVGGDPHLTVTQDFLYILSQDASTISEYTFEDLSPTGKEGAVPNAHGVTPGDRNDILVTNISDRKVAVYNTETESVDRVTDSGSTMGVAHNLAFNPKQNILALTLSGGNTVDFFRVSRKKITYLSSDVSGSNPFGLVYIER